MKADVDNTRQCAPASCSSCGSALNAPAAGLCPGCLFRGLTAQPGTELEGHEILGELGRGGMGTVCHARETASGREVALKRLSTNAASPEIVERFLQEMQVLAEMDHPAVLPLYHAGEDEAGHPYFTMKLARGGTLAARQEALTGKWREIAALMAVICGGVHHAHSRGVIHRDLKPANILFDLDGHAWVADFGLAKWSDEDTGLTRSAVLMGTPAYMAPEVAVGGGRRATIASDVYSLGAILYSLLTSQPPFTAPSTPELLRRIAQTDPPPPRKIAQGVPDSLSVISMKALTKNPERRYTSAAALAEDLQRWLEGRPVEARPASAALRMGLWARRNPPLAAATAMLTVSLAAGVPLLWTQNRDLARALQESEAATTDSQEQIEFMLRDLRPSLESVGRLDVMDSVLQNAVRHYEGFGASVQDPAHIARHALLYVQWADTLRARGRTEEATVKAQQALRLAPPSPREAALSKARIAACRVMAELLGDRRRSTEAVPFLEEASALAAEGRRAFPEDAEFHILTAKIAEEQIDAHPDDPLPLIGIMRGSLTHAMDMATATPEHRDTAAPLLALCSFYEGRAAAKTGEFAAAARHYQKWGAVHEEILLLHPDDARAALNAALADQNAAEAIRQSANKEGDGGILAALPLLQRAEERISRLLIREHGNLIWGDASIAIAVERMLWHRHCADGTEHTRLAEEWRLKMLDRIAPVAAAAENGGSVTWLRRARDVHFRNATACLAQKNPAVLREAMSGAMHAFLAAGSYDLTADELEHLRGLIDEGAKALENLDPAAGGAWLEEWRGRLHAERQPAPVMQGALAMIHRRLADRAGSDAAAALMHNFAALSLRTKILTETPEFPGISADAASALKKTSDSIACPEDARRLLAVVLPVSSTGPDDWRAKVCFAGIKALELLPPAEAGPAAQTLLLCCPADAPALAHLKTIASARP